MQTKEQMDAGKKNDCSTQQLRNRYIDNEPLHSWSFVGLAMLEGIRATNIFKENTVKA